MTSKKFFRVTLGIILACIFLWLIFNHLSIHDIKEAFNEADIFFILLAFFSFVFGYACRIERWRVMLKQDNPNLKWHDCAGPLMASVAANNILPLRAGDFLRAFAFNQRLKITTTTSLMTLFVERLLDLLMIVSLFGFALAYFNLDSFWFLGFGRNFLILAATIILLILLFPKLLRPLAVILNHVISSFAPKLGPKLIIKINNIFSALETITRGRIIIKLILWSVLAWFAEGFVFLFAAKALPSISNPLAALLALPVGTLATLIPGTPGYVGTFDFFTVQAMTVLENTNAASVAYALLVHALLWLPPTLIGGGYLLLYPVSQKDKLKVS